MPKLVECKYLLESMRVCVLQKHFPSLGQKKQFIELQESGIIILSAQATSFAPRRGMLPGWRNVMPKCVSRRKSA